VAFSILVAMHAEVFIELCRRNHALKRKHARENTAFRALDRPAGIYVRREINRRAFDLEADFQFVLNPNRQEEHQLNQALFGMFVQAIQLAVSRPDIAPQIRSALGEVYESAGKKNFGTLWPENLMQVQAQQGAPAGAAPGSAAGPAARPTVVPMFPPPGAIPPTPTAIELPPLPEPPPAVTPEEENVAV
jgi:hypothetical protein